MSTSALGRYAFINAKLRSRIGSMLDDRQVEQMLQSQSLEELLNLCKGTPYEPLLDLYDQSADIQRLEAWLFSRSVGLHREVASFMSGTHADVVTAMTRKLEVENLKGMIRLWFSNTVKRQNIDYRYGYLFQKEIVSEIDWERIVNAPRYEDIVTALARTPYGEAAARFEGASLAQSGLFPLETALDRVWVSLLWSVVGNLPADDRKLVKQVLDRDADLKNIINLVRFGYLYDLSSDTLRTLMLEGGTVSSTKDFDSYLACPKEDRSPQALVARRFPDLAKQLQEAGAMTTERQTLLVERYLFAVRRKSFRAILRGYPFSFGVILAYFYLEDRQDALIRTMINGINYGYRAPEIREFAL